MPKRKIQYSKRCIFWPCGDCRRNCTSQCVECNTCNTLFHYDCQKLDEEDVASLQGNTQFFTCFNCLRGEIGPSYSFPAALLRLMTIAFNYGYSALVCSAKREAAVMPENTLPEPTNSGYSDRPVDQISKNLLAQHGMEEAGVPLSVTADGNCLFNALSLALYGHEMYSTNIRVKTCIQLCLKKSIYMRRSNAHQISLISPHYNESVLDSAKDGAYSSTWTLMAAADALGISIKAVYPPVNGTQDMAFTTLNTVYQPTDVWPSRQVSVMWTNTKVHSNNTMWIPNHFSTLIDNYSNSDSNADNSFKETIDFKPGACSSPVSNEHFHCVDSNESMYTHNIIRYESDDSEVNDNEIVQSLEKQQTADTSEESADQIDHSVSEMSNSYSRSSVEKTETTNNTRDVTENITEVSIQECQVGKPISGRKWMSSKEAFGEIMDKNLMHFPAVPSGPKNNKYFKHFKYCTYKKRVVWFTSSSNPDLQNLAIYEYQGHFPVEMETDYFRTNPKTLDKIRTDVKTKRPKQIYQEAVNQSKSILAPRDNKQIRNMKYREEIKQKKTKTQQHNVADEILEVISMINTHPYVQEIVHTKDKIPSVICYTNEQIVDLRHFVSTKSGKLGIDRTFNLGHYFVTTFVYKNLRLLRSETKDNPLFLGPIFLHRDASYSSYRTFFSHISCKLETTPENLDIRIPKMMEFGTDDEKAMTKAIENSFPGSTRVLCTKHLKDNVKHYMTNTAAVKPEERLKIRDLIFGDNGLVNAEDTFTFEEISNKITTIADNEKFVSYFRTYLKRKIEMYVTKPRRNENKETRRLWTNNNAESINNVLKNSVNWKPQSTPDLIQIIYDQVKLQFLDAKRAIHGAGNYRLTNDYIKYYVSEAKWRQYSDIQKNDIFQKFLKDSKRKAQQDKVVSSNGKFMVAPKFKKVAAKAG